MCDFVDYDLGDTENEPESDDMFDDEPPAKKPRGANLKYDYFEEAESFDDLMEKAKNAGLNFDKEQGPNFYYKCKTGKCCYKWKAKRNDDFKYLNYDSENGHDHGDVESRAELTKQMKIIVDQRNPGNERVIQVICNDRQWPNMPALRQTINGTARNRRGRPRGHTQALLH